MLSEMSIHPALKALVSNLVLGCVSAGVAVEKHNESLSGPDGLERWLQRASELLRQYCGGEGIEASLVS
jgi:hypothetical protein